MKAILITAYKQVDLVDQNILRIRNKYKTLKNIHIRIVSTAEDEVGFDELQAYPNVQYIPMFHAPGNFRCSWFKWKEPAWQTYNGWGHKWIPIRVFHQISEGLKRLYADGYTRVLHIHSDTYWHEDKEDKLVELFEELENYYFMGDIATDEDNYGAIPKGFHFHPEGLFFNLDRCKSTGFGFDLDQIFTEGTGFRTHNYSSTTAMLGQFFHYSLTQKNVVKPDSFVYPEYYSGRKVILSRNPHGEFETGLVNMETKQ